MGSGGAVSRLDWWKMPTASNDQVPKPLTYTLMYHFLWFVLFLLSALMLVAIFAANGWSASLVWGPPSVLFGLAALAFAGFWVTYVIRLRLLLGEVTKEDGFRWSARSSWAVIVLAPVVFVLWKLALEPLAHAVWSDQWPVPVAMTVLMVEVEVVVWWISHLLSVRGLARGRKVYLPAASAASEGATVAGRHRWLGVLCARW